MISYLYLILLFGYVFLTIGVITRQRLWTAMMGMLLTLTGFFIVQNGLGNVSNELTEMFGTITTIVGVVFFLKEAMIELEKIEI